MDVLARRTAIQLAADKGYTEVVRELMRHGASAPNAALGSPSASPIYSVSYARPTTTPRAHPATTVGTRDIVRRLDEERFARNIDQLQSSIPTAEAGVESPRTVAPRPSPRYANPYRSSPRTHSDALSGSTTSPRGVPSNEEMRERLYQGAENGRGAPASPLVQYSPRSTAPRVSAAVSPRIQRNPEAERITAGLAASYRSISSSGTSPTTDAASASLEALQALKLHVANVVDHAISSPELQSRESAKLSAAVHLEEIAESLLKSAASLRPAGTPISSFLYTPQGGGRAAVTSPEEEEKSKQTYETAPTRTAVAAAPISTTVTTAAPALSLQPDEDEGAAEKAVAEQAAAEKAAAEKAAAEKAAAEKAAVERAAAERAAAEKAAAEKAAAEKAAVEKAAVERAAAERAAAEKAAAEKAAAEKAAAEKAAAEKAAAEKAAAEKAAAEVAAAEKAAAEKAAAENAAAEQAPTGEAAAETAAAEKAADEEAAAEMAAAEKAEQDRIASEKAKLAEEKAKLAAAREQTEAERNAAEKPAEDEISDAAAKSATPAGLSPHCY
eukprot:COSAG02_NODE_9_length_59728_cov_36.104714_39_plen_557_part_00